MKNVGLVLVKEGNIIGIWSDKFYALKEEYNNLHEEVTEFAKQVPITEEIIKQCEKKYWDINHLKSYLKEYMETNISAQHINILAMPVVLDEFIVSSLNNWMDGELVDYYKKEFECEAEDIVDRWGFCYSSDSNNISYTCGDDAVDIDKSYEEILKLILLCETNEDKIKLIDELQQE
jgi:hypothetical protein